VAIASIVLTEKNINTLVPNKSKRHVLHIRSEISEGETGERSYCVSRFGASCLGIHRFLACSSHFPHFLGTPSKCGASTTVVGSLELATPVASSIQLPLLVGVGQRLLDSPSSADTPCTDIASPSSAAAGE